MISYREGNQIGGDPEEMAAQKAAAAKQAADQAAQVSFYSMVGIAALAGGYFFWWKPKHKGAAQ